MSLSETKGVNWVDYYPHSDKPYLLTTSDDRTVKIFDYTTKVRILCLGCGAKNSTDHTSGTHCHARRPLIKCIM
jgi:coatomer subunit beta'